MEILCGLMVLLGVVLMLVFSVIGVVLTHVQDDKDNSYADAFKIAGFVCLATSLWAIALNLL